jgi:enamine deaminase RidA (YjgF/YER057c/UK114 family)
MKMKPICPAHFPWKNYQKYTYPLGLDLGDIFFLSGTSASEYDPVSDKVVARGDLAVQTRTAIEKIGTILAASDLSFEDVVSVNQYVTPSAFDKLSDVESIFAGCGLKSSTRHVSAVNRLMRRDALIELEVIAARRSARKRFSNTPHIERVLSKENTLLFVDELKNGAPHLTVTDAIAAEIASITSSLNAAGLDWSSIARCRLELATSDFGELDAAVSQARALLPGLPALPAIGVSSLPGSRKAGLAVEICASKGADGAPFETAGGLVRRVGSILFVTGVGCDQPANDLVGQFERIYGTIIPELLKSFKIDMNGIIQTVEWITTDVLPSYRETAAVRRKYLCEPFPVASGLVCSSLPKGHKVTVDIIATAQGSLV